MDDIPQIRLADENIPNSEAWLVLLPLLIVLSTFLFLLLLFLVCVLLVRRRRGISLRDHDGPVDMSREELVEADGGFEGVESRWLESESEQVRRGYLRAKGQPFLFYSYKLLSLTPTQTTSSNLLPILSPQISLSPSSSQYRRRVFQHGASSQTTRPSTPSSYTPAQRSPSSRTPLHHHVSNPISPCQS